MAKSNKGLSVPDGGAGGLPGVKKQKDMNAYAKGGPVGVSGNKTPSGPQKKAKGGGAATSGLNFTDSFDQ